MVKKMFAVCQLFAVCSFYWHTAKVRFAVCLSFGTQQSIFHTAYWRFPVVNTCMAGARIMWCMQGMIDEGI